MLIVWSSVPAGVNSRIASWEDVLFVLTHRLADGRDRSSICSRRSRQSGRGLRMVTGLRRKSAVSRDVMGAPAGGTPARARSGTSRRPGEMEKIVQLTHAEI